MRTTLFAIGFLFSSVLPAQTPQWTATRDLRIGSVDDPEYAFTWMQGITLDRNNRIYSLHYEERVVRNFDAAGKVLKKFGRRGEGPGEFRNPALMDWRGDTLWVYDSVQRRFHLFATDGRVLGTISVIPEGADARSPMPASPRALLNDGSILGQLSIGQIVGPMQTGGSPDRSALVRMTRQGKILDTLAIYTSRNMYLRVADPDRLWSTVFGNPYGVATLYAPAADGGSVFLVERPIATNSRQGSFTIRRIGVRGDTISVQRYSYVPQRVTTTQTDTALEPLITSLSQPQGDRPARVTRAAAERMVRGVVEVPEFHPPVQEIVVGVDGTLWLRREDLRRTTNSWMVLDGSGKLIGTVNLPNRMRVLAANRTTVLAEERDELDVVYITRYRITASR
ncbi:MAG: hypothetical protein WEE89_09725 [Gemmatimonadota bacterium]